MKKYTKNWLKGFFCALFVLLFAMYLFSVFMQKQGYYKAEDVGYEKKTPKADVKTKYYEPQDNVGAISFTEDQMTELARNLFSLDGFLNGISLDFEDGVITMQATITDKEKMLELYPELTKFSGVINVVENKQLVATVNVVNKDGRAAIKVDSVVADDMKIDGDVIAPFIENDDFSSLFDVEYDSVEISDGQIIFKNGLPDVLEQLRII